MKSSKKRVLHRMRHRMNYTLVEGLNCRILKKIFVKHLTSDGYVLLFLDFFYFRYQRQ